MRDPAGDVARDDDLTPEWDRPLWSPGGGDAFAYFVVFGADAELLEISPEEHRVERVPDGIDAHELDSAWVDSFFEPPMGEALRERDPDTAAEAAATDACIVVTGTVDDPPTLEYLRDVIGITTAALDTGGVGVLSLQTLDLFDPDRWRSEIFDADASLPHRLVTILSSTEAGDGDGPGDTGTTWLHTRGLRLFGRPDLSVRGVVADRLDTTSTLLGVLVAQLARGLVIDDGMVMDIGGDVGTLRFERRGDVEDPDFNNEHLEITFT